MKVSNRDYKIKISFSLFILIFAILTILSGIFQVRWYLREFWYSEPYYLIWNYVMFSCPYNSIYCLSVYIILSVFFLQGVLMQFILYRDFDRSISYYFSLVLMILGLFGCLIYPSIQYIWAGEEYYYYYESQASRQILPGFYWGLFSILLIVIRKLTIKFIRDLS